MKTKMITTVVSLVLAAVSDSQGALQIGSLHTAYTENFNSLVTAGSSAILPVGWKISETGMLADQQVTAGTGSLGTGNTYSYGSSSASLERALSGLQSGSLVPTFGLEIKNTTGSIISGFMISYFGEQWRLGAVGRVDRLDFQYSVNATSLSSGSWTDVNVLDFVAPVTSGSIGALNGNANRVAISGNLINLTIGNGQTIWFRWNDFNATGADDGLGIDDFSVTAVPEPAEWGVMSGLGLMAILGLNTWRERRKGVVAS